MSWTQSDLDALEKAIATGARAVKFEDREVEYRSTSELLRARELIRRALGITDPNGNRSRASLDKEL
jgi:hypothetical protein